MLKILDHNVYGLGKAVVASGLPMRTSFTKEELCGEARWVDQYIEGESCSDNFPLITETTEKHLKRAKKLAACKPGTGHDSFLKGILVNFLVTFPAHWLVQFERYHFADIISSQSTMHCLEKFDVKENLKAAGCDPVIYYRIEELLGELDQIREQLPHATPEESCVMNIQISAIWKTIIDSLPRGFTLTAYFTTNYLQLKSMYSQRKNHKLEEWGVFCDWIETLPMWKEWSPAALKNSLDPSKES